MPRSIPVPRIALRAKALQAVTCGLILTLSHLLTTPAQAATAYISDELTVPMRTGASNGHRILRILPAGARLEVRERDTGSGFARVTTTDGTEGWVPLQYLKDQPIARDRLEAATAEVQRLTLTVTELRGRLENVQGVRLEAEETNTTLADDVTRLEQELAEVKRASASALETATANQRLTELNARLRDELSLLVEERDRLAANSQERWLMIGGGLVLLGLFLGMILKARPRRSAWS
jgi:SH3 domain protein